MKDVSDFHVGELQLFSKKVHGELAGKRCVSGLGFTQDVIFFDSKYFCNGGEYLV